MNDQVQKVLSGYPTAGRDKLIPILQEVQESLGYISPEAVVAIGKHLKLASSKIYGVATFYNQFRFKPLGKYHIMICRGTACHVKGSLNLLTMLEKELKIKAGDTTRDGLFSLEVVACIGACGLAPVISVNGKFHANVTQDRLKMVLQQYREEGRGNE